MRYALTAMVIASIAAISAWIFGASLGQVLLVYVVVGIASLMIAALMVWLSVRLQRRAERRPPLTPTTHPASAHKSSDRP